ncbi:MAG: ATP-binding cassette domain-containing protein [Pseudomonadota bacterium]|nr:ATP-binding cassette domain-containing protein [Pseudomonadota bacterium]
MSTQSRPADVPLLQVEALACDHGGPFDFSLQRGECVAIVGRSGSGKSVLLRMIADLDPHQGEVWLDGRARSTWPAPAWRRQVVFQAAEPFWWTRTARQHFSSADLSLVESLLPELGLAPALLDAEVTRLSTGERLRMALVRSLACRPRVLLLDEPTAALDQAATLALEALLAARMQAGLSVLLVTHSREQAARVGHRLLEVRDQRIHAA